MRSVSLSACVSPPRVSTKARGCEHQPGGCAPNPQCLQHAHTGPEPRTNRSSRGQYTWISRTMWDVRRETRATTVAALSPFGSSVEMEAPLWFTPAAQVRGHGSMPDVHAEVGFLRAHGGVAASPGYGAENDDVDLMGVTADFEFTLTLTLDDDKVSYTGVLADISGNSELCSMFGPGNQSFVDMVAFSADRRGVQESAGAPPGTPVEPTPVPVHA